MAKSRHKNVAGWPRFVAGAAVVSLALMGSGASRAAAAKLPGDPEAGKVLFGARCAACHGAGGQGQAAPGLRGVVGAAAASRPDQKYSAALKGAGIRWTPANLDLFLKAPQRLVRGTAMMAQVPGAQDRQNLIAYLATMRK